MSAVPPSPLPVHSYEGVLEALSASMAAAEGARALLLVEFKDQEAVQAELGFQATTSLVNELAMRFSNAIGDRGAVYRLGDASCCVLVNAVLNHGHAILAAEKIWRAADGAAQESLSAATRLRIGIAMDPDRSEGPDSLLRKAQLASAAAVRRGERILVYDESCGALMLRAAELAVAYREALEIGALSVYYQPKIRIADGSLHGMEALMRWLEGGKPVSTPDVFIPMAEQAGLIHDTTWFALGNSLRASAGLDGLPVAVNITPGMLHHAEFLEMIRTAIRSWNVAPGVLTLELTEGALIADFGEAIARLAKVRDLGVRISIDDFGTGYSSLSYFKKIPAHEIKIDKSFVLKMLQDQADQRLVGAIISLARQFQLEVVAEGVEDGATLAALADMGCDYAQGYFYTPALDAGALRDWIAHHPVKAPAPRASSG